MKGSFCKRKRYLRVKDGTISGDTARFHSVHNPARHLGVGDDEDGLSTGLLNHLVGDRDHVGATHLAGVPDDSVSVSLEDGVDNFRSVGEFGVGSGPEDTAGGPVGVEKGETRSDTGPGGDNDDLLEQLGGVEETVEGLTASPELLGWVGDHLVSPVTSVGNNDRVTVDLAVVVLVGDGGESVPFSEGLGGDLETVEGFHWAVLEVETDSMVGEDLGVDITTAELRPGKDSAARGDDEEPKVGSVEEVVAQRLSGFAEAATVKGVMGPEGDQCDPSGEAMERLKVVVEDDTEAGGGSEDDEGEHGDDDPRRDEIVAGSIVGVADVFAGGEDNVEDEPGDSGNTSTTVHASVMEDFGESAADPKRNPVRDSTADFVEQVDKVFLAEEQGDHEIGGGGVTDVGDFR